MDDFSSLKIQFLQKAISPLVPIMALSLALILGAFMILGFGGNPIVGYTEMFQEAFGSIDKFADTCVRATPILLVGVGICIAFRTSVINIGDEGQSIAGALVSAAVILAVPDLPRVVLLPLALASGLVGGAFWAFIPGFLKAYSSVNEVLSTIMLNIVAGYIMLYLLEGPMRDNSGGVTSNISQTRRLSENADMPILLGDTELNLGIVIAVVAAILAYLLLWHTATGFELRAVGGNPRAAHYSGINVRKNIILALTLSGSMSGLAGAILVVSSVSHRLSVEDMPSGFTQLAGFNGIVAGLLGGLHPIWVIPMSLLFGGVLEGASALERAVQVATPIVVALSGLIVVFVLSSERAVRWVYLKIPFEVTRVGKEISIPVTDQDQDVDADPNGLASDQTHPPSALPRN